jgi:hypothetical protein
MLRAMFRAGALICVIAAILPVPCAWPQAASGTVSGTVRDQSGAVIPNGQVVLTNTATNVTSTVRTTEVGFYLFPGLIPGTYRLSVGASGMEKYEVTLTVQVAQSVVIDPVLKLGQTTTTVEVTDVTPLVTVDNPTVRNTLEHVRIEQLPMNQRMLNTLILTQPGLDNSKGQRAFGAPSDAIEFVLDGAVVTDRRYNMALFSQNPGVGAFEEFTVVDNAISAKYTRPTNFVVSTRSGTKDFHGTAYETLRNNGIGLARARTDFFTTAPELIRNEFGVSAGGPVVIPKVYNGRNRTFWFFNYEGMRQAQKQTQIYKVPTTAMRNGDFSGLVDSQGRLQQLYDPLTTGGAPTYSRTPFPNNQIPLSRMSPVAKYLFSITPLPSNNLNPLIDYNWYGPATYFTPESSLSIRIDHRFTDRDQFYSRYNDVKSPNLDCRPYLPATNKVAGWKTVVDRERSGSANWLHTFSPTFFNEVLAGGRYRIGGGYTGTGTTVNTDWFAQLGMPNPFGYNDWPMFENMGFGTGECSYNAAGAGYCLMGPGMDRANENYYTVDDNATKVHGKHEFQFGVHWRMDKMNVHPNDRTKSLFTYDTLATALYDTTGSTPTNPRAVANTGQNIANMFLGVSTYQASLLRNWYYLRGGEAALYFQDNYKVNRRLTVNLGLRWEHWQAYRDKNNVLTGFDQANHAIVLGTDLNTLYSVGASVPSIVSTYQSLGLKFESWKDAGLPQDLVYPRNKNFGPRLGFAYKALGGKKAFVVRGGYSLSYYVIRQDWVGNMNNNTPLSATFNYNPLDAAQAPNGLPNYGLISVPTYINGVNSSKVIDLSQPRGITRGTASANYFDPNLPDSRVHTWNLTLEKEVMASTVARARYVGVHGSNQSQWYSYNQPMPDYVWYMTTGQPKPTGDYANVAMRSYDQQVLGTVQEYMNSGWSNAQSLDFELERRYNKGYAYQLSYVVTNALMTSLGGTVQAANQYMPGAVSTDLDQRNAFLNYQRDTGIPKHRVKWNWLVDLPVGKGKLLGKNAGGALNKFIGGWQLAGIGSVWSSYFSLPTGNWNLTGEPIHLYGYQYPIQDCRGGSCIPGYLWWNGYIPANQINSHDASGKPNGYEGVPANYKPAVTPLIPWGSTTLPANAPANLNISQYWDTNNVWIPLKNGTTQVVGFNPGLHPWRNQYLPSVRQWSLDASLIKNVPIHEALSLRFAADFFNVFNHPDNPNSVGGDGFLNCRLSGQNPRVLQLGLRLNW